MLYYERMNMSLLAVSSSVDVIGVGAVKLHTSAQRCSQDILVGFEPTTFQMAGEPLNHQGWNNKCRRILKRTS